MKRISSQFIAGLFILLFIASSCKKDEQPSAGFSMKAAENGNPVQSSNQAKIPADFNPDLSFEWNVAWIYITHLNFDASFYGFNDVIGEHKYPDYHYEWTGNQKIDLLNDPKIFANMDLPDGVFRHFELTMTSGRFNVTDEPNFYLSGIYGPPIGGTPIAVSVTEEFDMAMTYDSDEAINTNNGEIFSSMVEMSLDNLFAGITTEEMKSAELTDGWILISKAHNPYLYAKILENLRGRESQTFNWEIHKIQ